MSYELERKTAITAVLKATQVCRAVQQSLSQQDQLAKSDRSPVTVADFGSQALIVSHLLKTFPSDPIVGEEEASVLRQPEQAALKANVLARVQAVEPELTEPKILQAIDYGARPCNFSKRYWTLDPIDGTKGFLRGDQYAVALALVEGGEVVLGVLACPKMEIDPKAPAKGQGCLLTALKGQGAFIRGVTEQTDQLLHVNTIAKPNNALYCESVESQHAAHATHARVARLLGLNTTPQRYDGQCKYAFVARGDVSLYMHLTTNPDYRSWIWDHAAGAIIVAEAGGMVTDSAGNALDFSIGRKLQRNFGLVVTNGKIHREVIAALRHIIA